MVQAGTPTPLVERYAREMIKTLFTPEVEERAKVLGFRPNPLGVEDFDAFLKSEVTRWGRIIASAKITAT